MGTMWGPHGDQEGPGGDPVGTTVGTTWSQSLWGRGGDRVGPRWGRVGRGRVGTTWNQDETTCGPGENQAGGLGTRWGRS